MLRGVLLWLIVIADSDSDSDNGITIHDAQQMCRGKYTYFVERAYANAPPRINLEFESSKHVRTYGLWIPES